MVLRPSAYPGCPVLYEELQGGVPMNEQVRDYVEQYPAEIIQLYGQLRQLVYDSIPDEPQERLWARLPSYFVGEAFVRLIPFRDHINIEARAALAHREEWKDFKMTPKGMVQIHVKQAVPAELLKQIFAETLA